MGHKWLIHATATITSKTEGKKAGLNFWMCPLARGGEKWFNVRYDVKPSLGYHISRIMAIWEKLK